LTEVLTSRGHRQVLQRRSSLAATVRELMPGAQPEERYSNNRVATKQMPSQDVLYFPAELAKNSPQTTQM